MFSRVTLRHRRGAVERGRMIKHMPALLGVALLSTGCVKQMAVNAMANVLSGDTGGSFTQDEDLQFVGEAIPFALKLMESIAAETPKHAAIHETLCSSFTQYAAVYVGWPAEQLRYTDFEGYEAGQARMRRFLTRSQGYCMTAWEIEHPGFAAALFTDTDAALAMADEDDISLLYWTGATWLYRISISKEDMEAIGELPFAAALLKRAYELEPDWEKGSLDEMLILLEPSMPMPGGLDRARDHYERAVKLSDGSRASTHVSLATSVSVTTQNKQEFVDLMEKALAIDASADPENQLATLYAQEQARFYLDHLDDLFVE